MMRKGQVKRLDGVDAMELARFVESLFRYVLQDLIILCVLMIRFDRSKLI